MALKVTTRITPGAPLPARARRSSLARRETVAAALFLSPTAVLFLVFVAGPMVASFVLTFLQWDGLTPSRFAGLDNYRTLLGDRLVRTVLLNTVLFVVADVVLRMVIALGLAVLVSRYVTRVVHSVFRSIVFFPVIISGVAIGILWQWLMNTSLGLINYYFGVLGLPIIPWLDSSHNALASLVLVDVWRNVGFSFVVFTAGLQAIPAHLYEAAAIDGAGEWAKFRHVTLPLLSPTTFFLLIINLINTFQFFDLSYVMTQGGAG